MKERAVVLMVVGVAGCLLGQGCAPTVRDPTTGVEAKYKWEALCAEVGRSTWDVYAAAKQAVDDLELRVLREGVDGLAGNIQAVDAHFDMVEIQLAAMPQTRTRLTIRIDVFGDKDKSATLFEEIMANLSPQEEPPTSVRPEPSGLPVRRAVPQENDHACRDAKSLVCAEQPRNRAGL